jgi:hypothetical protein
LRSGFHALAEAQAWLAFGVILSVALAVGGALQLLAAWRAKQAGSDSPPAWIRAGIGLGAGNLRGSRDCGLSTAGIPADREIQPWFSLQSTAAVHSDGSNSYLALRDTASCLPRDSRRGYRC